MAFKMRRTPLLVYDNGPVYTTRCYRNGVGGQRVVVGSGGIPSTSKTATTTMMEQTSIHTTAIASAPTAASSAIKNAAATTTTSQPLRVNFGPPDVVPPAVVERKKKFLTAKYGTHQMSLIKKRLGVEMWLYDEVQYLFGIGTDSTDDCEVELDLDELLDIDDENGRKNWLKEKLINAKQSPEAVKKFIDELISRAKTL